MTDVDLLIIGGGPAGLAAAIAARRLGCARVVVVDRERELGGIPRHAVHIGFGMRDLRRVMSGPHYARRYVDDAERAGVELRPSTTASAWLGANRFQLSSPAGIEKLTARAVILATGCRERPRAARLISGDRPLGLLTTGALQQLVYLHHQPVGHHALIVGAEHVSFSAVLTLNHAGAQVVAMLTEHARHQTYAPYKWVSASRYRVPILTRHRLRRIAGRHRVEAAELEDLRTGQCTTIACDTIVFTGDWIPDNELARRFDVEMDPATRAPRVDGGLRTATRGVLAAGNLIHAAETADIAALSGRHAASAAAAFLSTGDWPARSLPIACEPPIAWISPSAVTPGQTAPPRGRFIWRISTVCTQATVALEQGSRTLWSRRYRTLIPTLPLSAPAGWVGAVDPDGGPITFRLCTAV